MTRIAVHSNRIEHATEIKVSRVNGSIGVDNGDEGCFDLGVVVVVSAERAANRISQHGIPYRDSSTTALLARTTCSEAVHTPSELNVPSFGPVHNFDGNTFDLMA